jgi:uncharacterized protein (DUF983 family)
MNEGKHVQNDGKHCPACGRDIGLWPVFSAILPSRVRCPHCQASLAYGNSSHLVLGLLVLGVLLGGLAYFLALRLQIKDRIQFHAVAVGLFVMLWLPVEVAVTLLVRRRSVLRRN